MLLSEVLKTFSYMSQQKSVSDRTDSQQGSVEWHRRSKLTSGKAEQLRAGGKTFDGLFAEPTGAGVSSVARPRIGGSVGSVVNIGSNHGFLIGLAGLGNVFATGESVGTCSGAALSLPITAGVGTATGVNVGFPVGTAVCSVIAATG